eukprot:556268_1
MILYKDLVVKINEYLKTETVKKMKAEEIDTNGIKLEYEIPKNSNLTFSHLLSVLLYTDYSALCTDFSSTFRSLNWFEPLLSIKKRNECYWWMAKTLREAVQIFGYKKEKKWDDKQKKYVDDTLLGRFYSGLSYVLVFPSFELRLCSPTSTSKQIEVATKFATQKGIVVQLNNNVD